MTTVYEYRLYCEVEDTYVYTWGTTPPTLCPNNHANRNLIMDVTAVGSQGAMQNVVAYDSAPSAGYFQSSTIVLDIPSGPTGTVTTLSNTYPFDMYIWSCNVTELPECAGDSFTVGINPGAVIGALTPAGTTGAAGISGATGSTSVVITASSMQYLTRGVVCAITNGVYTNNTGIITGLDLVNNILYFTTPLTNSFSAGSYLQLYVYSVYNHIFDGSGDRLYIALKGLRSKAVQASWPIVFYYTNNTTYAKTMYFQIEYYMI